MKRILLFCIPALLFTASCSDLDDYNIDPKSPATVPGETLVSNAERNLIRIITNTNSNQNPFRFYVQHWAGTTYADESQYDINTRALNQWVWNGLYRDVIRDLEEGKATITANKLLAEDIKKNQLAAIEVLQVYAWSVLVNTFGDIPYTEALNFENVQPKFDDDAAIYNDLITRLDAAITMFDASADMFDISRNASAMDADLIYGGDVASWVKFANSLKLRMGITIADADPAKAATMVQQAAPNAFKATTENADVAFLSSTPNTNPLWEDLVQSGRQDFRGANTFIDVLNTLNDPRRNEFFKPLEDGTFKGAIYGSVNPVTGSSAPGTLLEDPTLPGVLLSYSEVEFLLAEAVERGFAVSGTAAEHYNAAITASILEWRGTTDEATAYLAQPTVNYATAAGDWKQKIGVQKWIALYNQPVEGWKEWRRLDYPRLVKPTDARTDIPLRFTYPVVEQNLNKANYTAASSAIGGDVVTSKIFWDTM